MKVKRIKNYMTMTNDIVVYNYGNKSIKKCFIDDDNKIVYVEGDKPIDVFAQITKKNAFLDGFEWGRLVIK